MSNLQVWQTRITEYNRQITEVTAEIATIDSETPEDSQIISMLAARKISLQDKLNNLNRMLNVFQTKYDEESLAASYSYTTEQQTIITSLTAKYPREMNQLSKMSPEKKTEFFTLYNKCANCNQSDCIVRCFFDV